MPTHSHTAAPANRLAHETSPYLLQHANNPVDWYPWCDEALEKARAEDKPIFLSVGYSTCYWCHVMERRCFEVESIAELMNEHHVNIKVDREERPDVDELYMAAVQIMNQGQGGWPMSVWIDPHTLKPFYAGTYFPPENHYGRPGFPQVIQQLASIWRERRRDVEAQANTVADRMATLLAAPPDVQQIGEAQVNEAVNQLMSIYDRAHGGFGSAPKFPQPVFLELLLAKVERLSEPVNEHRHKIHPPDIEQAIRHTLDRMVIGGMYDQVGGGFHRYSVDQHWIVPHFEKMLYDNGQLASLYARAAEIFDDDFYREITEETLDYVLREMTHEQGGFFSAQDAEVNAREGENYLWTADEVRSVLHEAGLDDLIDFALHTYGLDKGPNFRDPHDDSAEPRNVLNLIDRPEPLARALDVSVEEFNSRVSRINETLLAARDQRDQPATDDKILTGWNGLMIAAFAEGGRVLDETRYFDAAERAARFIIEHMRDERGELYRSYCKGEARVKGFLEDYALLAHGLLALHKATGERNWLDAAGEFVIRAQMVFRNEKTGGYFTTRSDQTDLFVRLHAAFDGAVPSGPSIMLHNLLDLYERTGDTTYLDEATQTLASLSGRIERSPTGLSLATLALHRFVEKWPDRLPQQSPGSGADAEPVSAELNTDAISLPRSGHVTIELRLRIADGYHINANQPGDANLQPLQIDLEGAGATVDVKYPAGEPLDSPAFADAPITVHSGEIVVPLHICESGEPRGEHHVVITCQPCTDQMCLEPRTIRLPIEITPA